MEWVSCVVALVSAGLGLFLLMVARNIWWTPLQIKKYFEAQGIGGPPYKLLYGNAPDIVQMAKQESSKPFLSGHNIIPRVLPAFHQWGKIYGRDYVYWFGTKPRFLVPHPELAKEVLSNKFGHYGKVKFQQSGVQGLAGLEGERWAQHRRILNPAFHMEALKGMIPSIAESGTNMCREWRNLISSGSNEIDVFKEFSVLTSDIISRTAFGSSYAEGNHIFHLLAQQILLLVERMRRVYIPGSRFIPTKDNRLGWWLDKEIKRCIRQVIEGRERNASIENSSDYGTDLLGLMMNSNKKQGGGKLQNNMSMTIDEVIAECRTFYIAGQETTTILLTWTMVLLGMHQDWQDRARREVLEVCGTNEFPNADAVNGLKIMGMILNESLRLYPPLVALHRQPLKPMKLGKASIPAGTHLQIPIIAMHHDPLLWGNDVHEFNPERFSQGISKAAKHPMAFMPFSVGPRFCIGQNFALLEAKVVLAMILQRFSFVISPHYIHEPVQSFTLKPKYGAQVIFHIN
ncbi:cytochrome P450 734A1 [Cryptomeria japonica]|uniref:cytochrome P450 734A1 n=1 Tax=Cryptomeria japonica TaxID=3369 RepID=UPI0027DA1408|nr:cytochrome P450 734A1 [Cryptomeria japonica]